MTLCSGGSYMPCLQRWEKPAGESMPVCVIYHANQHQRQIRLLFGRLSFPCLYHLSDTSLPFLDIGAMTEPSMALEPGAVLELNAPLHQIFTR